MISSDKSELSAQQCETDAEFSASARGYEIFRDFVNWGELSRSLPLLSAGDAICDDDGYPVASFTNGSFFICNRIVPEGLFWDVFCFFCILLNFSFFFNIFSIKLAMLFLGSYFKVAEELIPGLDKEGKKSMVPRRPGCDLYLFKGLYFERLQLYSQRVGADLLRYPDEIRQQLHAFKDLG